MNVSLSREEFRECAKQGNLIPVFTDLMADYETPVSVYSKLKQSGSPAFLLESIEGGAHLNRYSFIGYNPNKILELFRDKDSIIHNRDGSTEIVPKEQDPLVVLQKEMDRFEPVKFPNLPRFVGGAVGFLGYEYVHSVETTVPMAEEDILNLPVAHFLIVDTLIIFDRAQQIIKLLVNVHVAHPDEADAAYDIALQSLIELSDLLKAGREIPTLPVPGAGNIEVPDGNFTPSAFEGMVDTCKEYIRAGDVIQVVGSQRFEKQFDHSPLDLYRCLRVVNPSPYMFLYDPGPFAIVGASPEVHVRLTDGLAELRPIAGTRPRGKSPEEDLAFEKDLLADDKERAEHLMLVDLARNDLGRVCKFGSVKVPEYMIIERYSHVMHIVSQVEGIIEEGSNAYDLMRATFPAGTVSGAPKVRAMQIISEQEKQQRGPYAGAVCYFSYDGNLDSCIAIRTATLKEGKIYIQSGAGLVADSNPQSEYQETINKAKGMLKAVEMAENLPREAS